MVPKDNDQLQFDFLPLTVSIETLGGISTPLVLRGTSLPAKRSETFSTASDNQPSVEIKVLLGGRLIANKNMIIGSCLLEDIPPAPKGQPQIRVTFEVDRFCNVKVEAVETKSDRKIEATLKKTGIRLTNDLIKQLLREAEENLEEDKARSVIASADLRVRKDQEQNSVTATTQKIETLIAEIGIDLMESNKPLISGKTKELEKLLAEQTYPSFDFGDLFGTFYRPRSTKKATQDRPTATRVDSKRVKPEKANSLTTVATHTTALIQNFLENIDPELELKRAGAWEAVESNRADSRAQASHSMREVLRQLLDKLAPTKEVLKTPWYKKPESGASVTRAMRIRYALAGVSDVASESTFSLVNDIAAAVDSMYAKLSAESHSNKRATVSATRMYLAACEAVIGLIASQRQG